MPSRFERIYEQINQEVERIKTEYEYSDVSMAFGHFILKQILDINDDEANFALTDGPNDNGIDAIYIDQRAVDPCVHFFQFKFPENSKKIHAGITQTEVLKLVSGYESFTGNKKDFNADRWNRMLVDKHEEYLELPNTDNNVWHIVRYSTSDSKDNVELIQNKASNIRQSTGNRVDVQVYDAQRISSMYENNLQNNWPDFNVKYTGNYLLFEIESEKVLQVYVSVYDLYHSLKELNANICDGNVRFYDEKSKINAGIVNSLRNNCEEFYLLNNGITMVCSKFHNVTVESSIKIHRGSIINGAQTVGCIMKVLREDGNDIEKYKRTFVGLKVIQVEDKMELTGKLVYTLNTQNAMRTSYVISNEQQIKMIQGEINNKTDFFLEVKNNEFNHEKSTNADFHKLARNVIPIEAMIQAFVAYKDVNGLGYLAKNNKAELFDEKNITTIVENITTQEAFDSYKQLLAVNENVKKYRAFRKDSTKKEIKTVLKIRSNKEIEKYRYLNTGNFLVLYALGEYRRIIGKSNDGDIVLILKLIAEYFEGKENFSNLTRRKETFEDIKKILHEKFTKK